MKPPLRNNSMDDFQTPPEALTTLLPFINKDWVIWECAVGKANLFSALASKGYNVIGTDINREPSLDFLREEPLLPYDMVLTNPPYSLKDEFLKRAYNLGKPFAFLMPLTSLEGRNRQKLFSTYGVQLIIPGRRINFQTPDGRGSGSWFMAAWFTWQLTDKAMNFESDRQEVLLAQEAERAITFGGR